MTSAPKAPIEPAFSLRVEDLTERIVPMLSPDTEWGEWKQITSVTKESRFLGALTFGDAISDESLQRFAKVIDWLSKHNLIMRSRLAPVIGLPLAPVPGKAQRWALLLYTYSVISQQRLNTLLGCPMFINEGDIPVEGWPAELPNLLEK